MHANRQSRVELESSTSPDVCDLSSQEGAQKLKQMIEAYWQARGHTVLVALENMGFHPAVRAARYEVRSDMINGQPRPADQKRYQE